MGDGQETRAFNGRQYLLEHSLGADFSIVRGWKADWFGNMIYRSTAGNFNPAVSTVGRITVVEVEEVVPPGTLDTNHLHTPGICVDRLIQGRFERRIECPPNSVTRPIQSRHRHRGPIED